MQLPILLLVEQTSGQARRTPIPYC